MQRDSLKDLKTLGIEATNTSRWVELSRGEKERVAVVRSLASSPKILILDEPTSGLGVDETKHVLTLLDSIDATVIVATHDPHVMEWCDDIYELRGAQLQRI